MPINYKVIVKWLTDNLTNNKKHITPEIVAKCVNKFAEESAYLDDIRIVTICLINFAGFPRFKIYISTATT